MGIFGKLGGVFKTLKQDAEQRETLRKEMVVRGEKLSALSVEEAKRLAYRILEEEDLVEVVPAQAPSDVRLAPELRDFFTRFEEVSFGEMSILLASRFFEYDPPLPGMIVIGQNVDSQYVCVRPHEEAVYYVWGPLTKDPKYQPETDRSVYHAVISAGLDSGELPEALEAEIHQIIGISSP